MELLKLGREVEHSQHLTTLTLKHWAEWTLFGCNRLHKNTATTN